MNVLITGFTSSMTTGRSGVGYESLTDALLRYFKASGHTVSRQPMMVETNEADLAAADVMFVGICPFNALGSRYIYGALDAVGKAKRNNCALVFYVSDWQTHLLRTSIRSMLKDPKRFIKPLMKHRTDFEWANENIDWLTAIMQSFMDNPWPITLVPTHPWRPEEPTKLDINIPSRELLHIDPTAWTTAVWRFPEIRNENRQREWILAALGDYSGWMANQELTWPVRYFGGKTFSGPKDAETGLGARNKRLKEFQVNEQYTQVWGGLSPAYALSGSGWWRTRYHFMLRAGAILHGSPHEIGMIGSAFQYNQHDIEAMTDSQLADLAAAQRKQFRYEPPEEFDAKIRHAIKTAQEAM